MCILLILLQDRFDGGDRKALDFQGNYALNCI